MQKQRVKQIVKKKPKTNGEYMLQKTIHNTDN